MRNIFCRLLEIYSLLSYAFPLLSFLFIKLLALLLQSLWLFIVFLIWLDWDWVAVVRVVFKVFLYLYSLHRFQVSFVFWFQLWFLKLFSFTLTPIFSYVTTPLFSIFTVQLQTKVLIFTAKLRIFAVLKVFCVPIMLQGYFSQPF